MKRKILIVDDAPSWRRHHEEVIRRLYPDEFEIDTAASAMEGNEKLYLNADEPYDVILTDMQMESDFLPLLAGEWFIEQIQKMKEYYKTKIIIISASNAIRLIAEHYNVDYIPKYNCRDLNSYKKIFDLFN